MDAHLNDKYSQIKLDFSQNTFPLTGEHPNILKSESNKQYKKQQLAWTSIGAMVSLVAVLSLKLVLALELWSASYGQPWSYG